MEKSTKDSFKHIMGEMIPNCSDRMLEEAYGRLVKKGYIVTKGSEELSEDLTVDLGKLSDCMDLPNHGSLQGRNP